MKKVIKLTIALMIVVSLIVPSVAENLDEQGLLITKNSTLASWRYKFSILYLRLWENGIKIDSDHAIGEIHSRPGEFRTGIHGERVVDGGAYSTNSEYILGVGAGLDQEDLWYVTETYDSFKSDITGCYYRTLIMLLSFDDLYDEFYEKTGGRSLLSDILDRLVFGEGNVGIQLRNKVIMRKEIGNEQFIIGVDSLPFYDAFYAGSLTLYYNLDE